MKKTLPSLFLTTFCAVSTPAQADFSLGDVEIFKATVPVLMTHAENKTPTGNDYNNQPSGGFLHARMSKDGKCNLLAGAFENSVFEETIVVGGECEFLKTHALGGWTLKATFGGILQGYDNWREDFKERTGSSIAPMGALILETNLLEFDIEGNKLQLDFRYIPPGQHSAAYVVGAQYFFRPDR